MWVCMCVCAESVYEKESVTMFVSEKRVCVDAIELEKHRVSSPVHHIVPQLFPMTQSIVKRN